jgi:transposase
MRSPKNFDLSEDAATILKQWCRSTTLPHGQIMRAKIILQLSEGMTPTDVAAAQRTSAKTVHRWRTRFEQEGVDGLLERARSGRPTVIDKETVDKVLLLTTKHIPQEATHWSIELMAKYAEVTAWQVRQIWQAADLRPHRLKTFKISNDPEFSDKVIDIVGLYMNPPENAVVLSVDEKTQIQALDRGSAGSGLES